MSFKSFVKDHKSGLCLGVGLAFYFGSMVELVKATVRATHKIDERKKQIAEESIVAVDPKDVKLSFKETAMIAGPEYISSAVMAGVSTGGILLSKKLDDTEKSAWMSAYMLSKNASDIYKEATTEIVGENKEKKIEERAAEKSMERTPVPPEAGCTGDGNTLYYIPYLYLYFRSSPEAVNAGISKFEKQRFTQPGSLYEFLNDIGVYPDEYEQSSAGYLLGWRDGEDPKVKIKWKETGFEPCGIITFGKMPHTDFNER